MKTGIFVITLPCAHTRQENVRAQMAQAGETFEFVEGVDGATLGDYPPSYAPRRRQLFFGQDMTMGEIGCFLAHRKVYQEIVRQDLDYGLILEDDISFEPDAINIARGLAGSGIDFDLVRFCSSEKIMRSKKRWKVAAIGKNHHLSRLIEVPGGAHAYLVSRAAAHRLVQLTERIWVPIDALLAFAWYSKLNLYYFLPSPFQQDQRFDSLIDAARFQKLRPTGLTGALFPVTRALFRLWCHAGRVSLVVRFALRDRRWGSGQS